MSRADGTRGRLLLVEDDVAIANGLALNLRLEGFDARVATDAEDAQQAMVEYRPDLMLLDITLPRKSGLDLLAELRAQDSAPPVIVVSARQNEFDKVTALRLGADDYVTKPFGVAELLARIEAVLRRTAGTGGGGRRGAAPDGAASDPGAGDRTLSFGSVTIDPEARQVLRAGEVVSLTNLEFELLHFFVRHPNHVFSRDALLDRVWGVHHSGSARTVDNFVGQLRSKLEEDPGTPRHLITVRGSGYRFVL